MNDICIYICVYIYVGMSDMNIIYIYMYSYNDTDSNKFCEKNDLDLRVESEAKLDKKSHADTHVDCLGAKATDMAICLPM